MKASDLIRVLDILMRDYGDCEVVVPIRESAGAHTLIQDLAVVNVVPRQDHLCSWGVSNNTRVFALERSRQTLPIPKD